MPESPESADLPDLRIDICQECDRVVLALDDGREGTACVEHMERTGHRAWMRISIPMENVLDLVVAHAGVLD